MEKETLRKMAIQIKGVMEVDQALSCRPSTYPRGCHGPSSTPTNLTSLRCLFQGSATFL